MTKDQRLASTFSDSSAQGPSPEPPFADDFVNTSSPPWGPEGHVATLNAARVPTYPTEAEAVRGFQHLVRYRDAQSALMETPPSLPQDFVVDAGAARAIVDAALAAGQRWLDPLATHALLKAYGIPSAPVLHARDAHEAMDLAQPLLEQGASVALNSPLPVIRSVSLRLAAVLPSEAGEVYIRLVGPSAGVAAAREDFKKMLLTAVK